jgi:hypothetical protein
MEARRAPWLGPPGGRPGRQGDDPAGSAAPALRNAPAPGLEPFTPLYLLEDEYAAELANRTVHTVLHLGWVPDESGGYRGQMAVLVKPNGRFGTAYMAAIKPLRYLFVVPALLRTIERGWQAATPARMSIREA